MKTHTREMRPVHVRCRSVSLKLLPTGGTVAESGAGLDVWTGTDKSVALPVLKVGRMVEVLVSRSLPIREEVGELSDDGSESCLPTSDVCAPGAWPRTKARESRVLKMKGLCAFMVGCSLAHRRAMNRSLGD